MHRLKGYDGTVMSLIDKGMSALPALQALCGDIRAGHVPAAVTGLGHIHKAVLAAALRQLLGRKLVVLTADEAEASRLCDDLEIGRAHV